MSNPYQPDQQFSSDEGEQLLKAFTKLRTPEETAAFLTDMLSPSEIRNVIRRWQALSMLEQKENYLDIQKRTGLSSATIAKMSTAMQYGTGIIRELFTRLK